MKTTKIWGTLLIVLGAAICFGLIAFQYQHCVNMWSTTYKGQEYATALEYFFAVSKGAILISVVAGSIPALSGIILCIISKTESIPRST